MDLPGLPGPRLAGRPDRPQPRGPQRHHRRDRPVGRAARRRPAPGGRDLVRLDHRTTAAPQPGFTLGWSRRGPTLRWWCRSPSTRPALSTASRRGCRRTARPTARSRASTLDVMRRREGREAFRPVMELLIATTMAAVPRPGGAPGPRCRRPRSPPGPPPTPQDARPASSQRPTGRHAARTVLRVPVAARLQGEVLAAVEPLYLVYPDDVALPRITVALAGAYLPEARLHLAALWPDRHTAERPARGQASTARASHQRVEHRRLLRAVDGDVGPRPRRAARPAAPRRTRHRRRARRPEPEPATRRTRGRHAARHLSAYATEAAYPKPSPSGPRDRPSASTTTRAWATRSSSTIPRAGPMGCPPALATTATSTDHRAGPGRATPPHAPAAVQPNHTSRSPSARGMRGASAGRAGPPSRAGGTGSSIHADRAQHCADQRAQDEHHRRERRGAWIGDPALAQQVPEHGAEEAAHHADGGRHDAAAVAGMTHATSASSSERPTTNAVAVTVTIRVRAVDPVRAPVARDDGGS